MDRPRADTSEPCDGSIAVLASDLINSFKISGCLRDEVVAGLADCLDPAKRLRALTVIVNSVIVNYGNAAVYDDRNLVLPRADLDQILSPQLLEDAVVKPLVAGEYFGDMLRESVRLLFAASAYLPGDVYGTMFGPELVKTLVAIAEFAASDVALNRDVWCSCLSTIRNVICQVALPNELMNRLVNCLFNVVDENAVQLCNVIVAKILFTKPDANASASLMHENLGFTVKLSRRITEYLVSALGRTEDAQTLATACASLVTICEHSFGVDLFLEAGGLKRVTDLVLVVVTKHEALLALESKFKKPDASPKLGPAQPGPSVNHAFHELAFGALSVVSKVAFTSNHRQILALIESEVPETLVKLLNCPATAAKAKARACNTLGNLACETDSEVQSIIDADALGALIATFQNDLDHNVRLEAAYAICACLSKANRKQIGYIISCNAKTNHLGRRGPRAGDGTCMALIANMLDFIVKCDPANESSIKLCRVVLNGLENILRVGEHETKEYNLTENPYIKMFREAEGDAKLTRVCYFPEYNIAKKATMLLAEYFEPNRPWNMEQVH